jgi:4-hydroxysphinganine ceramide fatty acyl 2-hydroxylase
MVEQAIKARRIPDYLYPRRGSAVMFKNRFLESLTKTHPLTPLIVYLPIVIYFIGYSSYKLNFKTLAIVVLFFTGAFSWTLAEYLLHRFVFHFEPKTSIGFKIQFMIHGVHHQYPRDPKRLVMPPVVSLTLAVLFWYLFRCSLGIYAFAFFPGFIAGYIAYDMTHYAIHHFKPPKNKLRNLWKHHLKHHYQAPDRAFGVSTPLWDYIFGTT